MADPLLSELCSICHIHPHKYRCPRCSIRTCSLPCSKRHKQWSQCNGIRDPTVYIKRNELATPSGIDHDYNYLTSIERQLDNAERNALERGFLLEEQNSAIPAWKQQGLNGPGKGEMPMKAAIEKSGVIVERAPEGMAKRKQNATCWDRKRHRLLWTVEWIHNDGRKEYGTCSEFDRLEDAFAAHVRSTMPKDDPTQEESTPSRKRAKHGRKAASNKRNSTSNTKQDYTQGGPAPQSEGMRPVTTVQSEKVNGISKEGSTKTPPDKGNGQPKDIGAESEQLEPSGHVAPVHNDRPPCQNSVTSMVSPDDQENRSILEQNSHKRANGVAPTQPPTNILYFYLHAPRLPSPQAVLIPLSSDSTLSECLRNNLVLEFPSIYAIQKSPSELPEHFITEADFDKKMQQEDFKASIMAKLTGNEEGEIEENPKHDEDVDAKKLEEVLIRDLRQLKGEP